MSPTLMDKNICIYRKIRNGSKLAIGDIIIFKALGLVMVKRLLGLPGQKIVLKKGIITIDGMKHPEPYLKVHSIHPNSEMEYEWNPKNDEFVVLSDNRLEGKDSRYFSVIPTSSLIGKVIFRIYPICN